MKNQSEDIGWRDDVPVSERFDDPYYSLDHGLEETAHVFLQGNDLPARFRPGFHIAELGFGTGLNLLAAWALWREQGVPGPLSFTSFEAYPVAPEVYARAHAAFPEIAQLARALAPLWQGYSYQLETDDLSVTVIVGDARTTLPVWAGQADAWFLDGFAPAKNPELWDPALLQAVADKTAPGGTVATYTAAGAVRRSLAQAGFEVSRVPGFGRKRHMTRACKPSQRPQP